MRIRKKVSKWSFKIFTIILLTLLALYNLFFWLAGYFNETSISQDDLFLNWLFIGAVNPLVLSAILTTVFRTSSLFIQDHGPIADFPPRLKSVITTLNMRPAQEQSNVSVFRPTHWFYSLFNAWFGSEKLTITWGGEITIAGSARKISALEDILSAAENS